MLFDVYDLVLLTIFELPGGALKPTDVDPLWVHVTCAWFRPEVSFASDEKMEPALGILCIPSNSFVKVSYWLINFIICLFLTVRILFTTHHKAEEYLSGFIFLLSGVGYKEWSKLQISQYRYHLYVSWSSLTNAI